MVLRSRRHGIYILGLLAALNFINYANRNVIFPMYDDLRASFGFSNAQLGLLGTAYMLSHALCTVPVGWAADRYDRRRVMAIGIAVWSVAAVGGAAAVGFGGMLASRLIIGMATAVCVPVANALLCDVFPADQKARVVSIFNVGLFLGGAAGFAFGGLAGFPGGFLLVAVPGFALAVLIARLDVPPHRVDRSAEPVSWRVFARDAALILHIRTMRWMLAGAVLMSFAAGGYLAWFTDFVIAFKGLSREAATLVFGGCALTGGLAGVMVGGLVGDRLTRRVAFGRLAAVTIGMATAVPFALLAILVDSGPVFYASAWLLMFFVTWYHGPMAAAVDDLVPDEHASTGQASFIFTMHFFGTAPAPYVIGRLADAAGLRWALIAPTGAMLLGALCFAGGWPSAAADRQRAQHS